MELKQAYDQVMDDCITMALATSVGDKPNVRVVNYGYDKATPEKVYFTTFKGNQKIAEFEKNSQVALFPLPEGENAAAQVRIFGQVKESEKSLKEVAALIIEKDPSFAETFEMAGDMLVPYEVQSDEVKVTVGMTDAQTLEF